MLLLSLPKTFNPGNAITPPIYRDHLLFFENLQRPYECTEYPSGLGLLTAVRGHCNYFVNGAKNQVSEDRVLFVNRSSKLAIRIPESNTIPALLFFDSRLPDIVQHSLLYGDEDLMDEEFHSLPYDFSYLERIHAGQRLYQTIASLIGLGSSCSSFAALKADMMIRHLFENLLKENLESYKLSKNIQAIKASTRLEIFKRVSLARDWMDAHYNNNITLEDIAALASMNSQHFLRMFKQVYHITPHQYLIDLKLKKAKQLLGSSGLTIAEICQTIGFESVFSFSILFKDRFGLAPAHFREAR